MIKDYQIIITTPISKNKILKTLNKKIHNIKIYTIKEFNKLYYFDYNEESIYYLMTNYNIKYDIAKIYINNLYYIEDKTYKNSKLNFLHSIKMDLLNNKLLIKNPLFKEYIKNKKILLYNLLQSKEINRLRDELNVNNHVDIINDERQTYKHQIYKLSTDEEEVVFVANQICNLIKKGISLDRIFLTNIDDEYRKLIKRIFPMFNIPYTLNDQNSIYGTNIISNFISSYNDDLTITIENIKSQINNEEGEEIYNKLISIINKYTFISNKNDAFEMIKYDLKKTKFNKKDLIYSIHEIDLEDCSISDEDYVFIMSFNQGIIPKIYKDEEYLTDKELTELSISLTIDKNNQEKSKIINIISSIKNAIITYKLNAVGEEFNISSINEELNYEIISIENNELNNNDIYNKIKLTSLLDEYYKYGTKSQLLDNLNYHYQELPYKNYNHKFTGINTIDLKNYLNNKLTLSYSSLDKYYRCPFSYYIGNILKLNIYEETFYQLIGTLFHSILEKITKTTLTFDELWIQEINNLNHNFNFKEKFFLEKLKKELEFIIETIKEQENFTNLHDELHEEQVYVSLSGDTKITFTGIIDKIKYKKEDNQTIIAIIDYKTGNPNLDLTTTPYGIGMQLPVYLYLAKNSKKLENIKIAGFYLQKILNNEITVDNSHSYEQLKKKNLLLQGYSNSDLSILSEFDTSFMDSNIIKGIKLKKDNSFYHYSNVIDNKTIDKITDIVENKIKEGAEEILKANFSISPKKIGKNNYGCSLCKFKDICFHTNDDIVELKTISKEEILGGDNNGMDEGTGTSN